MDKEYEKKLDEYIKNHLSKYVQYHLDNGYELHSIKECLKTYGYSHKELNIITKGMVSHHKASKTKYHPDDLEGETYYYIRGMISNYIKKQEMHGFKLPDIRNALLKYGHHKNMIDDAIAMVRFQADLKVNPTYLFFAGIITMVLLIFALSAMLKTPFIIMLYVFCPAIITYGLSYIAVPFLKKNQQMISIGSIVLTIVLFMFIFPLLENAQADSQILLVLNAIMAFFFTGIYVLFYTPEPKKVHKRKK
ncbi:MFS transporter [Candidatus Venteria ishoeyi]|uniref:Uncharacterized protein n=1 Tax=Candidatus Venteria ishoeyi TaxID=1899563 RepID=A0A1H6F6W8_9GAMM|nr:MFS transporter [Candidatus Venteria ishoeyi]SEH05171.1 Uncharacterised protein [Candidatus Venteria ishoeyi]